MVTDERTQQMYNAYEQQSKSRDGKARNQCRDCGVFRLDGQPPTVHKSKCSQGPDGSQLPPVFDPAPQLSLNPHKRAKTVRAALASPGKHTRK